MEDKQENDIAIRDLEARILQMENRVFGEEGIYKNQQKREIIEELVQVNGQIQRAFVNRDKVNQLMKKSEEIMELLSEEGSGLLGGEAKANALLAAEPFIRQMYDLVKDIKLDEVDNAMNSTEIRNLPSLEGKLTKLQLNQMNQKDGLEETREKIILFQEIINLIATK